MTNDVPPSPRLFFTIILLCTSLLLGSLIIRCDLGGVRTRLVEQFRPGKYGEKGIYLSEQTWNLGKVPSGKVFTHSVQIVNNASTAIDLLSVKTSCGCTAAELPVKRLEPSGSAEMKLRLVSEGRHGVYDGQVIVNTSDRDRPALVLQVKADFQLYNGGLVAVPARIEWGNILRGSGATRTLILYRQGDDPLNLESADSTIAGLVICKASQPPVGAPPNSDAFEITLSKDLPLGAFSGNLVFRTHHKFYKDLQVPVAGEVTGNLVLYPQTLFFNLTGGRTVTSQMSVVSVNSEAFKIQSVAAVPADSPIRVRTEQISGSAYRLHVSVEPSFSGKITSATLEIRTSLALAPLSSVSLVAVK